MTCDTLYELAPVLVIAVLALAVPGCVSDGIEEAAYSVETKDGDFEVRVYVPQVVAETRVRGTMEQAGNLAFRPLFDYISGNNRSRTKIAMTAPVGQESPAGEKIAMTAPVGQQAAVSESDPAATNSWTVTFMMPSAYTMDTLPAPVDDRVRLRAVPARRVAAVRYPGTWSRRRYEQQLARLRAWMSARDLKAGGPPLWARYNPPITPWFMRRNEVLLPLVSVNDGGGAEP